MEKAIKVKATDLQVGDILENDTLISVDDVISEDDGTWVEWSDGDSGYVDENTYYRVFRSR